MSYFWHVFECDAVVRSLFRQPELPRVQTEAACYGYVQCGIPIGRMSDRKSQLTDTLDPAHGDGHVVAELLRCSGRTHRTLRPAYGAHYPSHKRGLEGAA